MSPVGDIDGTFPKKERLVKTREFRKVYSAGRSVKAGPIILKVSGNESAFSRIGFSISARSVKRAVRRNRIRRLFREVFRKNKGALKKGFDMVVIVRQDPGAAFCYDDASRILLRLAKEAAII